MVNNIVELENGDKIELFLTSKPNTVLYVFKNKNNNKIGEYTSNAPAALTSGSNIAIQIKQSIDPNRNYKSNILNKKFQQVKELMQLIYENQLIEDEQQKLQEEQKQKSFNDELMVKAKNKLQSLDQPLIYIGSLIDWKTAGERNNILLSFVVYAGQIILNNPVSLIALGEAGSGKSHVQEVALSLVPKKYVLNEKKITEAALFNRAKLDKYFYDGKIVNYGDMGGSNDHSFMEESKNLMKELQSDGYLNKPLNVPDEMGGWTVKDLELVGRPILTYTTVPNYQFDDQEMSRSIFITPRMDNKKIFNRRNLSLEFKHGKTYNQLKKYEYDLKLVPYMVLHLKEILKDVDIINPYVSFVIDFLKQSSYYKRDFPKFNGLLKTITALNYYNNKIVEHNGDKILLTSINDVQLFMSLLRPYQESISANISPKAVEVLNDLRTNIKDWSLESDRDSVLNGITTTEYFNKQELGLSKPSVKKYFSELFNNGFLRITDNVGRANVYDLSDTDVVVISENLQRIDESIYDNIRFELGDDIVEVIKQDEFIEGLDINNQDIGVDKPKWLK